MTDRKLLESAAKAAGVELVWHGDTEPWCFAETFEGIKWNPLTDDGDALRLAVKLGLFIQINSRSATAWKWRGEPWYEHASDDGGMNAATRRAIVRAAAEIGKNT